MMLPTHGYVIVWYGMVCLVSPPPPLERARCRDIGLPPTWAITTRETDSTHIHSSRLPHLYKLIEGKWVRKAGGNSRMN